ncbi:VOC family protein [Actinocrispum wychmicini]|uniref:Glyoxalase/bleomycin resistance protein/dioxygenase superfamily protein n=1 Tax=Actinocrispum wychmicini TaxID=1213861 RepID=A0A4R2J243_9PSEU|nr:VOC family protein [Actinocrispum wychmicini]TCO52321.1 glyoxalase/bleomycin resistance protein/dioxygenase superfamily protein [Actinocrispum wychmicini]
MSRRGRPRHPDQLTPAEWRVADAVRHGLTNSEIARRRGVSLDAVKFHVANAVAKLGLANRAALRQWPGVPADSALAARTRPEEELMLGPVGQVSRTVADLGRAKEFYGDVLGLKHLYTFDDLAFFDCDGVRLYLQRGEPGSESVLYFRVSDIGAAYDDLRERGVDFLGAPHLIFRHESGIEEWMAFFTDPDGHTTAIMSQVIPG